MIGYVYSSTLATILATAAITTTSASLFGDSSTTGDDTITQNQHLVTICMTEEDCVAAAVKLGVTTVYTDVDNSATKGCFQKNGKVSIFLVFIGYLQFECSSEKLYNDLLRLYYNDQLVNSRILGVLGF